MPLHTDYRPKSFDEFFGNEATILSLEKVLSKENKPHTYLFVGPSGCGKTTLARILANELGCSSMDLTEYNISDARGVDSARAIIEVCQFEPLYGDVRVIILDECQQATKDFQNALLKVLEEPPPKLYFVLCTTEPEKLLLTIKTRSSVFKVSPLDPINMGFLIDGILGAEKKSLSDKVKKAVIGEADGCTRKALVILDQIIDLKTEDDQLKSIPNVQEAPDAIKICKIISDNQMTGDQKWKELQAILKTVGKDNVESIRYLVLSYMTSILLNSTGNRAKKFASIIAEFSDPYFNTGKSGLVISCYMSTLL